MHSRQSKRNRAVFALCIVAAVSIVLAERVEWNALRSSTASARTTAVAAPRDPFRVPAHAPRLHAVDVGGSQMYTYRDQAELRRFAWMVIKRDARRVEKAESRRTTPRGTLGTPVSVSVLVLPSVLASFDSDGHLVKLSTNVADREMTYMTLVARVPLTAERWRDVRSALIHSTSGTGDVWKR